MGRKAPVVWPCLSAADLFRLHYLGLVRLAVRLVDDQRDAEDLVQDVFAAVARRPPRLDDPYAYLRRAVVNRSHSVLRRRRLVRALFRGGGKGALVDVLVESADEPLLRHVRRDRIRAAISRLPSRQKEAVVLRYYEDLPVTQIATVLDVSPGAVSAALHRAHAALATALEPHDAT